MDRDSAEAISKLVDRAIAAAGRLGAAQARLDVVRHAPPDLNETELEHRVDVALRELLADADTVRRALALEAARAEAPSMREVQRVLAFAMRRRAELAAMALALGPTPPEAP